MKFIINPTKNEESLNINSSSSSSFPCSSYDLNMLIGDFHILEAVYVDTHVRLDGTWLTNNGSEKKGLETYVMIEGETLTEIWNKSSCNGNFFLRTKFKNQHDSRTRSMDKRREQLLKEVPNN